MNKRQLEAAKKVIDGDATGWGQLIEVADGQVMYCALGGLGKAAGMTDKQLQREDERHFAKNESDWAFDGIHYPLLARRLKEKFGINPEWLAPISSKNDWAQDLAQRRSALKKLLDKLYAKGRKLA